MALKPVHCRVCKETIDRELTTENVDWIQPSNRWYYHLQCYNDFAKKKKELRDDIHADVDNEVWFAALWDYLKKDLRMSPNGEKIASQWQTFLKKGYTGKGIYFGIRYFYEVNKGDPSGQDGIGIVPYIYTDSCQYWVDKEQKDSNICAKIEAQIRYANQQEKIVIQRKQRKKPFPEIDLSSVRDWEK